ncbi:amino acid ABC transporter permease [Rhizobium etli]|uniref:amino acid ABC transporter permease n=1 Tax=Rhizobium etli TaxID=29449 RepID=UPI0003839932|nr:amino acid ABC transporter permease [Rhizobium etli]AGS25508.1 amino acid ABC transporter permease protein [Rhizobium etli bv. mimosae str. Mim1]
MSTINDTHRADPDDAEMRVIPLKHYGRWTAACLIGLIVFACANSMLTNPRFKWDVVWQYIFDPSILQGLYATIWLTIAAMLIGTSLGTVLAIMRISKNPLLSRFASAYAWLFRGSPLLVQLIFWYNLSALYPTIDIGIPFGPTLASLDANQYITIYVAAVLGLGLNEGAYMSEIVRSGLNAVPQGQREAAEALGMTGPRILFRIILPQAMRVIVPPTGNQLIGMLKTTSLVSVIAMQELLYSAQLIYSTNFQTIPLLIVASIWYLVLTTILSFVQYLLERHFGRSDIRSAAKPSQSTEENVNA